MKTSLITAAIVAISVSSAPVHAAPIVYTLTTTATGVLNDTPFVDALLTITAAADTSGVAGGPALFVNPASRVMVDVAGVGSDTLTGTFEVFVNQAFPQPPFGVAGVRLTASRMPLLLSFHDALTTYDLATAIGPLTGPVFTAPGAPLFVTSGGDLSFVVSGDFTSRFTASVQPVSVPEPAALVFLGTGLAISAAHRRGRRAR